MSSAHSYKYIATTPLHYQAFNVDAKKSFSISSLLAALKITSSVTAFKKHNIQRYKFVHKLSRLVENSSFIHVIRKSLEEIIKIWVFLKLVRSHFGSKFWAGDKWNSSWCFFFVLRVKQFFVTVRFLPLFDRLRFNNFLKQFRSVRHCYFLTTEIFRGAPD